MFIVGHQPPPSLMACIALLGEVPRHFGVDVVEHGSDVVLALLGEDSELFGFLLGGADRGIGFRGHRRVPLLVPFADRDSAP